MMSSVIIKDRLCERTAGKMVKLINQLFIYINTKELK
jgi:hypothetical protein